LICKKQFLSICLVLLTNILFADNYSDAVKYINSSKPDKALPLFYKVLKTDFKDSEKVYISLKNITEYETDIVKTIQTVKTYLDKLNSTKKNKSEILFSAAIVSELSGRSEDAVNFYLSAYNEYPVPENSSALLLSAAILIDNGEFNKALNRINFFKKLPLEKNDIYKGEILESVIYILSGEKEKGEKLLNILTEKTDISVKNLSSIVLVSARYNMDSLREKGGKKLLKKNSSYTSLFSYNSMISPAAYLNYSSYITEDIKSDKKSNNGILIQTGSYSNIKNAENMKQRLKKIGFAGKILETDYKGKKIFKVIIPAENSETAEKYHIMLKENSIESFLIFQ
jgi:hypothetical protein